MLGRAGRRDRPRPPAARRPEGLRDAAGGRHRGPLPGREPRADGDPAAHEARPLLRPRGRGGDHPARADRGEDGPPVPRPAERARAGHVPAPVARADPEAHARGAALPGAAPAHGDDRGRLHRRRGRGAAPRDGLQALGEAHEGDRGAAAPGDGRAGDHGRGRGGDRALDPLVRALRLSRVARGELRAHRLRERVPEGAPPGRVRVRAPQQPADGLLPPVHAGEGRAAPRRALPAGGRDAERLALRARGGRGAPGARLRARPARGRGLAHRGGAGARGRSRRSRTSWTATGLRRDEQRSLAEVGALNAFGLTRRSALWQVEKAGRPRGPLFRDGRSRTTPHRCPRWTRPSGSPATSRAPASASGAHPVSFYRQELCRARRAPRRATCRGSRTGSSCASRAP